MLEAIILTNQVTGAVKQLSAAAPEAKGKKPRTRERAKA
jgi:hypothetical protein